jgi:hypothetical protein
MDCRIKSGNDKKASVAWMNASPIRDEPRSCTRISRSPMRPPFFVMPGLVPGIPIEWAPQCNYKRNGRDKPGHDGE